MKLKTLLCRFMFAILLLFSTQHTFSQCFEIESILVDACGPTEGLNEMVRFKVGSSPLNTSSLNVVWPNNSWGGIVQNAATAIKVAELNAAIALEGGCGQLLEPPGGILPANSTVILVTSYTVDTSQNTFGPLSSTLYIIFQNATTTGGHFVNQGTTPPILRPLTMSFGLCTDTVVYNKTLLVDGSGNNVPANGATVNFTPEGVTSYTNPGCTAPVEPFTVDAGPATLTACAGATIALNGIALGEQSVLWSAPSGSFSSSSTAVSNYTIPVAAGGSVIVLTLTATNSCAQNISDTINLTVTAITTPNFATTLSLCSGATAPALATTSPNGVTGTWLPATISNTVSGNYVFTPTVGLCASPVTLAVTITTPTVPNFATTLTLCSGAIAPALATTSPNGVTGTWLPATISNTVSGNYVFTPTVGLCASPITLAVTITTPIVPNFATTLTLCSGATAPALAPTSPNGVTGTWLPATISNTVSGNYVFTPTVGLCASPVTLAVTITTPTVPNFATTLTLCSGATAPILATTSPNGVTGTWLPATISNITSGNYVFTPTVGLCAIPVTLSVTITTPTIPNFTTTLTLCSGATAPALATTSPNGVTGTWLPATISNTISGNYAFTPTVGLCATPVTLAVTITTPTVPNFATTLTFCSGAPAPALATTSPNGVTGAWLPATISNTISGNYAFTPTVGLCATPVTLAVTITTPTVPNFATTLTLCSGAIAPALATTSPNGVTGTWLPATISNTVSGNYIFTPTVGLCATPVTLAVTITTPIAPNFATTLTLCSGAPAPALATTSPNGITGTWLPATISNTVSSNYMFTPTVGLCAAPVTLSVTITTPTVPDFATTLSLCSGTTAPVLATISPNGVTGTWFPATISNTTDGNYVFTPTVGLCAAQVTLVVTITTPIVPDFATTLSLCSGTTAPVLATTSPNGVTGTWLPATISNITSGNYVFTPTVGLCAAPITLAVTITTPIVPDFATTLSLCSGTTAPVLATISPNGVTGTWLPATISNTTDGNYVFTPTVGLCASSITLVVTVNTVDFTIKQGCVNDKYLIEVLPEINLSDGDYTYIWTNGSGVEVGTNNSVFNFTEYDESSNGNLIFPVQFTVTITKDTCQMEQKFEVTNALCSVSKGISPNGDGINDTLDLKGFDVSEVSIFNRYGMEVYHYKGKYVNEWKGQHRDGTILPTGTYYYMIKTNGGTSKTGWIYINN